MMYNPRDSNNNYEEGIQDVSNEVVEKEVQMDHMEDSSELAKDDNGKDIEDDSSMDIEDDSCMEICGDEVWVKE